MRSLVGPPAQEVGLPDQGLHIRDRVETAGRDQQEVRGIRYIQEQVVGHWGPELGQTLPYHYGAGEQVLVCDWGEGQSDGEST